MSVIVFFIGVGILSVVITFFMLYISRIKTNYDREVEYLNRSVEVLEEALSCTNEYLWRINLQRNAVWVQDGFEKMIGIKGVRGYNLDQVKELILDGDYEKLLKAYETMSRKHIISSKDEKVVQITIRLRHGKGHNILAHLNMKLVRDQNLRPLYLTGAIMDVTSIIATESALKDAYRSLEETRKSNAQFLAKMSHEIRTPLNGISGYVQLLERELKDDVIKGHIGTIKESTEQLVTIMSEIIEAGRLEAGEVNLKIDRVHLGNLMDYFDRSFRDATSDKGLTYKVDYDLLQGNHTVLCDELRLNQILYNILNNSIKQTEEGTILFNLHVRKHSFNRVELMFRIEDSGSGIKNKKVIKYINGEISEEDVNLATENSLGLSIVYNLVKMMKGCIHVTSSESIGTLYEVSLIVTMASEEELISNSYDATMVFNQNNVHEDRILIAEDNDVNRTLLADIMHMLNYQDFDLARDGQEALDLIEENDYKLIITDIQMPHVDGNEVARRVRSKGMDMPIVAMTANVLEDQLDEYYQSGINDYVPKPVDVGYLKKVLSKYIE
jgi:signal transduction histidine kinase/CheY-like chemotaxis protein